MRFLTLLTMAFVLTFAGHAKAESQLAKANFERGMRLLQQKKWKEACDAFRSSEDPDATVATRYQLGKCSEEQGLYASAQRYYLDAAKMSAKNKDEERAEVARGRAADLDPKIPKLVVTVPEGSQAQGMVITIDDEPYAESDWGKPRKVDPGSHKVHVTAPGRKPLDLNVDAVGGGKTAQVAVPPLAMADGSAPPAPGPVAPAPGAVPMPPQMERRSKAMFYTGIPLICVGGLSLVAGAISGLVDAASDSFDETFCNPEFEICEEDEGGVSGATIGLLVFGVAGLGSGITLTVIGGKKVPVEPEGGEAKTTGAVTLTPLLGPGAARGSDMGAGFRLNF